MKRTGLIAAVLIALLGCGPIQAQTTNKPEWSDITEVVVRAQVPGPAMWKLTRGESTVWVLGTLVVMPDGLNWDKKRLARALDGAQWLITPAVAQSDPAQTAKLQALSKLPPGRQLADALSPAVMTRFERVARREGLPLLPYQNLQPVIAAGNLSRDVLSGRNLSTLAVYEQMKGVVRKSKVRVRHAGSYDQSALIAHYAGLDTLSAEACVINGLDGLDYDLRTTRDMAKAWAAGHLAQVMALYREPDFLTCVLSGETTAVMYQTHAIAQMSETLLAALEMPGKSVAIVPFDDLLRRGGVLDQLRAEGVDITAPAY